MLKFYKIPDSPVINSGDEMFQANLTQREAQILIGLYHGLTQNELANLLGLSRNTVRNHISNMSEKLGKNSTIGCIQWYVDQILLAEYGKNFVELCTLDRGYDE
jgi:DNA-binding NarL/FixJ family response regulator